MISRNQNRNQAPLPSRMVPSGQRGRYVPHEYALNSCANGETMINSRSLHIPRLIRIEATNSIHVLRRTTLEKNVSGTIELQTIVSQKSGAYCPVARSTNAFRAYPSSPSQAKKNSLMYE